MKKISLLLFAIILLIQISDAQNVGIGTATPLMQLHIRSGSDSGILLENTHALLSNVSNSIYFKTGSGSYPYTGAIKTIGQTSTLARIGLFTYASPSPAGLKERLSILDDGTVGVGTTTPDASAKMEISSATQGFLPPRMSKVQRNAIATPAQGLIIYCTDCVGSGEPECYNGGRWISMLPAAVLSNVFICNQQWETANLNVTTYANGDSIPQVTDPTAWGNLTTGAWCYYNNDPGNDIPFGKLYNGYAINDPRGLAPTGWHIPTDGEWTRMSDTCINSSIFNGAPVICMRDTSLWYWNGTISFANNNSGFSARGGGYRSTGGVFTNNFIRAYFWTSTSFTAGTAWYHAFSYDQVNVDRATGGKNCGFSVRCVKD